MESRGGGENFDANLLAGEKLEIASQPLVAALQHVGNVRHQGGVLLWVDVDPEVGRFQQLQVCGTALCFGHEVAESPKAWVRQHLQQGVECIQGFLVASLIKEGPRPQVLPTRLHRLINEFLAHPGEGVVNLPAVQQRLALVLVAGLVRSALPHAPGNSRQQAEAKSESHKGPKTDMTSQHAQGVLPGSLWFQACPLSGV